jgi:hypothetical protein
MSQSNEMQAMIIFKQLLDTLSMDEIERVMAWLEVYAEQKFNSDIGDWDAE